MLMRRVSLNSLHDLQRQSPVNGSYILSERRREGGGRKRGRERKQRIAAERGE